MIDAETLTHSSDARQISQLFNVYDKLSLSIYDHLEYKFQQQRFYDVWPNQTVKERILGHMFFPRDAHYGFEPTVCLYSRHHVLLKLAYTAKQNDLLAMHYLNHIFDFFAPSYARDENDSEENDYSYDSDDSYDDPYRHLNPDLANMKLQLGTKLSDLKAGIDVSAADLQWLRYRLNGSFNPSCNHDVRMQYIRASSSSEDVNLIRDQYKSCLSQNYPVAFLGLAQLAQSNKEAYDLYLQAGNHGISDGYHRAALMIVNGYITGINLEVAAEFFEKAGNMGQLNSYENAATIWKDLGDINKVKSLYLRQGAKGDPHGYLALSKFYPDDSWEQRAILSKIEGIYSTSHGDKWFEEYFGKLLRLALSH